MLKRLPALILCAVFFAVLWPTSPSLELRVLMVAALAMITFTVYFWLNRLDIRQPRDVTFLLLPVFWIAASAVAVWLQGEMVFRFLILIIALTLFLRLQLQLRSRGTTLFMDNLFFVSAIGIYLGIWAVDFFLSPGWWIIMGSVFISSLLFFWVGFFYTPAGTAENLLYSSVLALMLTEIAWAMLFWPLHYITVTGVFAGIYYLMWELTRAHLRGSLTRQKIWFHASFVILMDVLILVTALWLPHP